MTPVVIASPCCKIQSPRVHGVQVMSIAGPLACLPGVSAVVFEELLEAGERHP